MKLRERPVEMVPENHLRIARSVAGAWASKVRNRSMFDDFYQVATIELWLRGKDVSPETDTELVEIIRSAIRRCWREYKDRAGTFSMVTIP